MPGICHQAPIDVLQGFGAELLSMGPAPRLARVGWHWRNIRQLQDTPRTKHIIPDQAGRDKCHPFAFGRRLFTAGVGAVP
jgi:hypothetical protein